MSLLSLCFFLLFSIYTPFYKCFTLDGKVTIYGNLIDLDFQTEKFIILKSLLVSCNDTLGLTFLISKNFNECLIKGLIKSNHYFFAMLTVYRNLPQCSPHNRK